jgi:small GTP-binding protein
MRKPIKFPIAPSPMAVDPDDASEIPLEQEEPDYLLKLVLIGDSGVGKTSVLSRFARNKFNAECKTTIGVEFATKTIEIKNKRAKVQVWDTAGQERYRAVTSSYYKGTNGAFVVYDISSSPSFASVPRWLSELRDKADPHCILILVGNKCDNEDQRSVTEQDGKLLAERENMLFIETSAKNATNIAEAFTQLVAAIVDQADNSQAAFMPGAGRNIKSGVALQGPSSESRGCC